MALTATADIRTQINVFDKLALTTSTYFIGDLNRPNLKVIVKYNIGKKVTIQLITKNRIENKDVPAIVFCTTKKHAEMLAKLLEEESVTAKPYHSGIDKGTLDEIQKDWMENKIPTVCATIGFGMGVDEVSNRNLKFSSQRFSICFIFLFLFRKTLALCSIMDFPIPFDHIYSR